MRISLHHLEIVHKRFVLNRNQVTNLAFCASLMNKYKWNFFIFFMLLIRARDAGEERWVFVLTEARYEKVGNCVSISWHGNGERWLKAWKCFNEWQAGWNGRRWHYTNSSRSAEMSHILGREKCLWGTLSQSVCTGDFSNLPRGERVFSLLKQFLSSAGAVEIQEFNAGSWHTSRSCCRVFFSFYHSPEPASKTCVCKIRGI